MCEFKTDEHKMTAADVRRIARGIVWHNTPSAIAVEAEAIVSATLANDPFSSPSDGRMYWQPDTSYRYADRHQVTDDQFTRIVTETYKLAQRVSKMLGHPVTNV